MVDDFSLLDVERDAPKIYISNGYFFERVLEVEGSIDAFGYLNLINTYLSPSSHISSGY